MDPLIGSIMLFAGNFAPRGYMLCQGQLLPISQYQALFSILGTTYGGDGVTNFALPNLASRVPIGTGQGLGMAQVILGQVGGAESVSLTTANMPMHTHPCVVTIKCVNDGRPSSDVPAGQSLDNGSGSNVFTNAAPDTAMASAMASAKLGPAGNSQPFEVRSPYLGMNFCIAIEGVYPSRN